MTQLKRATIHDVAREAGVSYQTVSRVINNQAGVASKTRANVLRVIQSLDYQPVQAARNLSLRRSHTIQIIAFNWNDLSLQSIVLTARKNGYQVNVIYIQEHNRDELMLVVSHLASNLIDGAVLVAMPFTCQSAELLEWSRGVPIVQLGGILTPNIPYVGYDPVYSVQLAVDYLYRQGHRRIAEISGSPKYPAGPARHAAVIERLSQLGLKLSACVESDWTASGGYESTRQLLDQKNDYSAFICGSDLIALGAMSALWQAGKRVPEDVSVIGFDDIAEAAHFHPALTTIRQDFDKLGQQSVEYLIDLIEKPNATIQQRIFYPELVVRESVSRSISEP